MVFPIFVFALRHPNDILHTLFFSSPPPAAGWRGEWEVQRGKYHRWRYKQFTRNNSEIRNWTIRKTMLNMYNISEWFMHNCSPHRTLCYPTAHFRKPEKTQVPFILPVHGMRWYQISPPLWPSPSWLLQKLTLSWTKPEQQVMSRWVFPTTSCMNISKCMHVFQIVSLL